MRKRKEYPLNHRTFKEGKGRMFILCFSGTFGSRGKKLKYLISEMISGKRLFETFPLIGKEKYLTIMQANIKIKRK